MKPISRTDRIFLVALIVIHAVFYLLALKFQRFYNGDSSEYIQEAFNIKDHFFFYSGNPALPVTDEYKTLRTPGYPFFLLLIYSVAVSNKLVLLLQNAVSIFNIAYARRLLNDLGYHKKYDWLLLLFVILFPSQFVYANTIAPDILLQTFVLLYCRFAIAFFHRRSWQNALAMSGALIAGLFVKPVLYPLAFLNLLAVAILMLKWRLRTMSVVVAAMLPLLAVGMYSYWNQIRTGKYHFTSIQSFNAVYYHNNYFIAAKGTDAARDFLETTRNKVSQETTFAARYDAAQRIGVRLLAEQPLRYMCFHLKKSFLFFFETGRGELDLFSGKMTLGGLYAGRTQPFLQGTDDKKAGAMIRAILQDPVLLIAVWVLVFDIVKVAGLILFLYRSSVSRTTKWFVILLPGYFALITGPISNAHYVLPVSLLISGLAAAGYGSLLQRKKNNSIITI